MLQNKLLEEKDNERLALQNGVYAKPS